MLSRWRTLHAIFPHPYNGGVANDTETCQTKPEYNRATLLLGKNLVYKARIDDSYISVQENLAQIVQGDQTHSNVAQMQKLHTIPGPNSTFACTISLSRKAC